LGWSRTMRIQTSNAGDAGEEEGSGVGWGEVEVGQGWGGKCPDVGTYTNVTLH